MNRRDFLQNSALLFAAARAASAQDFNLEEATLSDLEKGFASGRFTARSVAEWYLARIDSLDKKGPKVNAVIELNPDALAIADALDRERKTKGPRGPLHGVPVLIKDNIDTADRMMTTAGSLALEGHIAARDSFVAERLRAAGAVILGKTNLSEWANFRSTHSISGWSGRGRQTLNPYALDRNPSGSSSGSGAGVSANFCAIAVGTETDGSVTAPASTNGVVGIKPTVGLIGGSGIIPISHSQDTAGPLTRTVRDAAILLGALAVPDKQQDFTKFLDPNGLKGARLGVERSFFGGNATEDHLMEECLAEMKRQGAVLVDPAGLLPPSKYGDDEIEVMLYEFKTDLNQYLSALPASARVHSLADVIKFNRDHAREEMPFFEQEMMERSEKKGSLTEKAYRDARQKCIRLSRDQGIDAVLKKHNLAAIVAPTCTPAILNDFVLGDTGGQSCTTPAAVAGYPHITVPAGFVRGLPVGISFFGAAFSEPVLLKLAYSFEQATKVRRAPKFLATVELSS